MAELNCAATDPCIPLHELAFHTLRTAILKGEMRPGEQLLELKLAQKLGVSRSPVREALRKLEQEGLVETMPRKTARVAEITEKDMQDVLQIRCQLETLAARLCYDNMTDIVLAQLKKAMKVFEAKAKQNDVMELAKADIAFHDIIYRTANNPKLLKLLNELSEPMYRYRIEYMKDDRVYPILVLEHQEIVQALEEGNMEKLNIAVERHLKNQENVMKKVIQRNNW